MVVAFNDRAGFRYFTTGRTKDRDVLFPAIHDVPNIDRGQIFQAETILKSNSEAVSTYYNIESKIVDVQVSSLRDCRKVNRIGHRPVLDNKVASR